MQESCMQMKRSKDEKLTLHGDNKKTEKAFGIIEMSMWIFRNPLFPAAMYRCCALPDVCEHEQEICFVNSSNSGPEENKQWGQGTT